MDQTTSASATLGDRMGEAAGEAEGLLDQAAEATSREYNSALKKAAEQLRRAQAEFIRLEELALDRARDAARATDDAVHDHPYAAMGAAACVGLLVGLALFRR